MSIDVSLMRNKENCDGRSMRNREQVIVKTPDVAEASHRFVVTADSARRSSTFTGSDTESLRDNASTVSSSKDCASDRGRDSSDESVDANVDPKERVRLKLLRDRRNALDELISTEKSYINDLAQIVQGYMEMIKKGDVPKPESLAGKELMVFGNLQQIYEWHKNTFQPEMEKYIDIPQKLGTIFTRFEKRFYMYVKYCENKPKSEDITYEHLDYFEQLREILDHKLQLADMLIKPVQRIMKYELLLKAIMKYTEKAGEDVKEIQRAIEVMCIIPRAANDMMNVGRLQGFEGDMNRQGRLLLQDTLEVSEHTSKSTLERISFKERKAFLFERVIIFSKTVDRRKQATNTGLHYMCCASIGVVINKMILTEMPNNSLSFKVLDNNSAAPVQYLCQCKTENIKKNWVTQIKRLLENQTDFIKALQFPISYVNECSRIDSGNASVSVETNAPSGPSSPKNPPKSVKKKKSTRSFKNLFIKSVHEASNLKIDCSPATPNSRKFSLPFFEAFSNPNPKTPEVYSKSKWFMLARRKESTSPQSPENKLLLQVGRSAKHLSVSNENIWADKSSDSERDESDDGRSTVGKVEPKTAGNVPMRNPMLFREVPKTRKKQEEIVPCFTKGLENVTSTEGSTVSLTCQLSTDSSLYAVTWMGPSDKIFSGNDDVTMENHRGTLSLKLSRVLPSHSGMYKCKICCNEETTVTSCYLKVLPEILPKPKKKNVTLSTFDPPLPSIHEIPPTPPNCSELLQWSHDFKKKYELLRVIERGKFSVLHACMEKDGKTMFVAKSYPKMVKTKDSVFREAAHSSGTNHSGIVKAVGLCETEDSFIILFPFFPTRNRLFDYIVNMYSFDAWQAVTLGHQLFSCLFHLHDRNILHLTIKPENFDIDLTFPSQPLLKLMDFSEARLLDPGHPYVHHFTGDTEFTPPEVFHNSPLTFGHDVWCAAIMFYAMLCGTTPFFGGDGESTRKNVVALSYSFPKSMTDMLHPSVVSFISSILVMPPSQRPNANICFEKSRQFETVSRRNRIDKRLFLEFVKRRQNLQM